MTQSILEVKILSDAETAKKVGDFLVGPNAFSQTWAPNEKAITQQAPIDSIGKQKHRYWYVENPQGQIIGAMGVRENKYGSDGYEMDADYLATHKDYRNQGIARALLETMEAFVKENGGRYIHVLTCDIDSYAPARVFYAKHGYKKVAEMPNYYVEGEGRIDFYKELT